MITANSRSLARVLCIMCCSVHVAHAQPDTTRAALRLHVQSASTAVPAAAITLESGRAKLSARTDSTGDVRIEALGVGIYRITVMRVGFAPARVDARVGAGENALTINLDGSAAALDAVRIVSNRPLSARLDDFEMRRLRGEASGTVTREEIAKRNPMKLSQLLRGFGGIRIADSLGSIVALSSRGNKPSRNQFGNGFGLVDCAMRTAVDGVLLPSLTNLDGIIVPNDVYGIEIFNGPARLPPQFGGLRTDNWCGLIMIWTRDR